MTERTIDPAQRPAEVVELEAKALGTLVERRHEWLNEPNNRLRSTYSSVKRDTAEMERRLAELAEELENALKIN